MHQEVPEQLSVIMGNSKWVEFDFSFIFFNWKHRSYLDQQNTKVPETGQITHGKIISIYSFKEPLSDALG